MLQGATVPCATVILDKFSAYNSRNNNSNVEDLRFDHYFINHSLRFADLVQPFIYTNNIERMWRSLKASTSHVKRSLPEETIDTFINAYHFQSFFPQEAFYDVLLQMIVSAMEFLPNNFCTIYIIFV